MLDTLLALPAAVFFLILGIIWNPKPERDDEETSFFADDDDEDAVATARPYNQKELLKYFRKLLFRIAFLVVGGIGVLLAIINGLGSIDNLEIFLIFLGIYGGALLILQRAEREKRFTVLLIVALIWYVGWVYSISGDYEGENNWGLVLGLVANILFYVLIGRRFDPRNPIEVITD